MPWTKLPLIVVGATLICVGIFGKNLRFNLREYYFHPQYPWFRPGEELPNWLWRAVCISLGVSIVLAAVIDHR
jgi:hypothetical protein